MRLGVRLPSFGHLPIERGIAELAERAEDAGADSLWCSDHVVMTKTSDRSRYPFSVDGRPPWSPDAPWLDAVVVMSLATTATRHIEVGCAVMILAQRHPVVLSKQLASLSRLTSRHLALGVGAGWYREEFEALSWDFTSRGERTEEWLHLLRACWTGRPAAFSGAYYDLPADVIAEPTPAHEIPLLMGGMSPVALRRAGQVADGWLGLQPLDELDPAATREAIDSVKQAARESGRNAEGLRMTLRVAQSEARTADVARHLSALRAAGLHELIIDVGWDDATGPERSLELLRSSLD